MAIVGAGGLGSPVCMYLTAGGVGHLILIDDDVVDLSNLQRQVLHGTSDVGALKVQSAQSRLAAIDPGVRVDISSERIDDDSVVKVLSCADLVVDCSDNYETRHVVARGSFTVGIPHVWGAVEEWRGQIAAFAPHLGGPCYACLFPGAVPNPLVPASADRGIVGATCGVAGSLQAAAALQLIIGTYTSLGILTGFDLLRGTWDRWHAEPRPDCHVCAKGTTRAVD